MSWRTGDGAEPRYLSSSPSSPSRSSRSRDSTKSLKASRRRSSPPSASDSHSSFCRTAAHSPNDVLQQVVGQRPRDFHFLQGDRDGVGLARADPDRQIAITVDVFQYHHPVLRHQADADTVNRDFYHVLFLPRFMRQRIL